MNSSVDDSSGNTYRLTCTDCTFQTTVEGTPFEALEVADSHQAEFGGPADHFVNFELSDGEDS